ncbi:cysteine hydrolase [Cyanobacteria bacterium FACHB-63]|nr:cysteine hydrolase [Cyanobacteria bacterium FACHB-63]
MLNILLIVDAQVGFINDFTHHIPQRLVRLIQTQHFDAVIFTRFINDAEGPYSRLLQWHGCDHEPDIQLVSELQPFAQPDLVFSKIGICGLPDELINYLRQRSITQISVAGIDTDMCVLKIAMDLFDLGIEPIILTDCCASTAGLQAHLAGLAVLSRNIGAQRLKEAGVGDGTLAAP